MAYKTAIALIRPGTWSAAGPFALGLLVALCSDIIGLRASEMAPISGRVSLTDADTFRFEDGTRVRLFGVDAPEKNQMCEGVSGCFPCGKEATEFVSKLINAGQLQCVPTGDVSYNRIVASCSVNGKDIALELLRAGWALPTPRYLKRDPREKDYLAAAQGAMNSKTGIHQGKSIEPAQWRKKQRLACELP